MRWSANEGLDSGVAALLSRTDGGDTSTGRSPNEDEERHSGVEAKDVDTLTGGDVPCNCGEISFITTVYVFFCPTFWPHTPISFEHCCCCCC